MPSKQVEDVYNAMAPEERANWGRRGVGSVSRSGADAIRRDLMALSTHNPSSHLGDVCLRSAEYIRELENEVFGLQNSLDAVRRAVIGRS